MNKFEILITSPPDRESLVAEIWYNNMFWAEISEERGELLAQFYPHPNKKYWEFSFNEAMSTLDQAKRKLLEI